MPLGLKVQRFGEGLAPATPDTAHLSPFGRVLQALGQGAADGWGPQAPAPAAPTPTLPDQMRGWVKGWRSDLFWTSAGQSFVRGLAELLEGAHGDLIYPSGQNLSDDALYALSLLATEGSVVPRQAGTLRSFPVGPSRPGVTRVAEAAEAAVAKAPARAEPVPSGTAPEAGPSSSTAEPAPSATLGPSTASGEDSVAEGASAPRSGATQAKPTPGNSNPYLAGQTPLAGTRVTGINRAKALEIELVQKTGAGTSDWTAPEIEEIIRTGELPGKIVGHHINNVAQYREWAGDPRNIEFVRGQGGNLDAHGGNFRNPTTGPLIDRAAMIREATGDYK